MQGTEKKKREKNIVLRLCEQRKKLLCLVFLLAIVFSTEFAGNVAYSLSPEETEALAAETPEETTDEKQVVKVNKKKTLSLGEVYSLKREGEEIISCKCNRKK